MGLFVNKYDHPEVYTDKTAIWEQNQRMSTIDPLAEWILEQKEANHALHQQLNILQAYMNRQEASQAKELRTIRNRLNGLQEREGRQEQFENEVMESFVQLHAENHNFHQELENEQSNTQEIAEELNNVKHSTIEMARRLEEFTSVQEEITTEVKEQLLKQEKTQQAVIGRLENQEGLTEKLLKQMDHLRSVLYERSNFLVEKIEGGYLSTSHFISRLLAGSEQPTARFMVNQKQDEKKENVD